MKSMMAAVVLAGALIAPALSAGEPSPEVAKAIAEIEARRAAKAEAAAKAAAAATQWKGRGEGGVILNGGGQPGATIQLGK